MRVCVSLSLSLFLRLIANRERLHWWRLIALLCRSIALFLSLSEATHSLVPQIESVKSRSRAAATKLSLATTIHHLIVTVALRANGRLVVRSLARSLSQSLCTAFYRSLARSFARALVQTLSKHSQTGAPISEKAV